MRFFQKFCVIFGLLVWVSAQAQQPTPATTDTRQWSQTFEEQLPGEAPQGWTRRWGDGGDDLLSISNVQSLNGHQALLLDRTVGANAPMSGVGVRIPDIRSGWAVATINLFIDGAGHDAQFSLLIREEKAARILASIGVNDFVISATGVNYQGKMTLGHIQPLHWYRIILMLPTRDGAQKQGSAQLFLRDDNGTFLPCAPASPLEKVVAPESRYSSLELVTATGCARYLLYLDDLSFAQQ